MFYITPISLEIRLHREIAHLYHEPRPTWPPPAPPSPGLCQAGRWQSPAMAVRYTRSQAADRGAVARYYRHS